MNHKNTFVISQKADAFFKGIYDVCVFILHFFKEAFSPLFEWKEIIAQCYVVGYKSLPLVSLTGFITGIVFTKQSRPSLSNFGASSWLPSLVSIAIIKALAPLVTALIATQGKGSLGILLNDPTLALKLMKTAEDMGTTVSNFNEASLQIKEALMNLHVFSQKLNTQGSSINNFVTDTSIYKNIKSASAQFRNATYSMAKFSNNIQNIGERLEQQNNVIGILLNDTLAATLLKKTLKNAETSTQKLDEDLEAVQHNFLLRGFFRKKEKAKE